MRNFFQQLLDALQAAVDQIKAFIAGLNSIWSKVTEVLGHLFSKFCALIQKAIDAISSAAEFVLDAIEGYLKQGPELLQLYNAKEAWRDEVAKPFSEISANFSSFETSRGMWSGEAYDSYSKLTASQGDAASKISVAASSISDALGKVFGGLIVFYSGLTIATVTFIAGVTAGAAATATGVGAPAGSAIAGISLAQWAGILTALLAAGATLATTQVSAIDNIKSVVLYGGSSPFAHNRWPDGNRE